MTILREADDHCNGSRRTLPNLCRGRGFAYPAAMELHHDLRSTA
jgi:hypothetical protein